MNHDELLELIADCALKITDDSDGVAKVAITVQCGGLLVSGYIASKRDFLMSSALTNKILEDSEKLKLTSPGESEDDESLPEFLHLSHARYFIQGQAPLPNDENGVFWRCRLSEVAGFHVGLLTSVASPADLTKDTL